MKYIFLLLLLSPFLVNSQNSPDPNKIFSLEEVDQPPLFPGCESNFSNCNNRQIIQFLVEKIEPEVLAGLSAEESRLFVKIIIDKEGKVRRPMVQSKDDEVKILAMQLLKELPAFKPATKDGKAVNVIFSIPPVQLVAPSSSSEPKPSSTAAIATACSQIGNAEDCTMQWLMENFLDSFFDLNIKTRGKKLVAEVHINIDSSGKVTGVEVEGENQKLRDALYDWASKLPDFVPATENGEKVESTFSYPISFSSTR